MIYIPKGKFIMGDRDESNTLRGKKVFLQAFLIDRFEVSRGGWRDFMKKTDSKKGKKKFPVSHVDYFQAEAFCKSKGKRLPTEAEWEKAARGLDGRKWAWLIYHDHPNNGFSGFLPEPVDKREEWISPYGVYGMGHNVWEWTSNWYEFDGMLEEDRNTFKVIRGGLLQSHLSIRFTETWFRNYMQPNKKLNFLGFRCARDL